MRRRRKNAIKKHTSRVFSALVYLFLYAPIAVVILFSFNTSKRNVLFEGFTLDWYAKMAGNTALLESFKNTLLVAGISTAIATVIGTITAIAMFRYKFRGKSIIDLLLYIPVVIPEIVLGIALLSVFSLVNVPLGLGSMIVAHVTFQIPFIVFTVRARLSGFDRSIEDAAMDLGANRIKVLTGITIPIIAPGIVSGAVLAFTLSIDDIIISFFTTGAKSTTFPLKIMELVRSGVSPDVYALSTIIILATFVIVLISQITVYRANKKSVKL
ncbi:MAG: ABC transporter permease [Oscillospiraceae bacterium]|jgi:spermidine/putrescine transport system permease protein|nr:ABC transporter permease [Oscillospiraceae bacterium]